MPRLILDVDAVADSAFALADDHAELVPRQHAHNKHQLLYAVRGVMTLSAAGRRWTLPPQRAAFLPAGVTHAAASSSGIELRTVYLTPSLMGPTPSEVRVFGVTPLAREMIVYAMRWPPRAAPVEDATRDAFFQTMAALATEWMADARPYHLPEAQTDELLRATRWIEGHLSDATVEGAARAARVSVRTLSRRFEDELGMSFRNYLQTARMMAALEILARPRASISQTAFAVGFKSMAAFTTAFHARIGETPTEYRKRVTRT